VLNVGKVTYDTCLSIDCIALPIVESARDLVVTVSRDLSRSLHINNIVAKAHKCTAAMHLDLATCAYLTFVRSLVEHDSK